MKRIAKTLILFLTFSLVSFLIAIASPVPNIGHTRSLTGYFVASASPIPDTGQTKSYTETFGEGTDYSDNLYSYTKLDAQGGDLPATAFTTAESGDETIINIPADYTHIQSAIDASHNGDVIIVHPGTYYENIDFLGKAITVRSTDPNDPNVVVSTIIDGSSFDSVVKFINEEDTNCVLSGFTVQNGSSSYGGGIYCYRSSPTITNCTISGNSASDGGGIYCYYYSSPSITNCTISGNSASDDGGGVGCYYYSSPTINSCTISGNSALDDGGGIYCGYYSSPTITDSILWNDSPSEIFVSGSSTLTITYSNIQGGHTGEGNICADPLFIDTNADDFHLSHYSPCIDQGDPNSSILEDKEGITRPQDGNADGIAICDMGAYEYTPLIHYCYIDTDGDLYGNPNDSIQGYSCPAGYVETPGDCHDNDNTIYPGATELYDSKDNDCDGSIDEDFGNLNFGDHSFLSYAGGQDSDPDQFEILDGGTTLSLWGNNWMAIVLPYPFEITRNTVIEFDFLSEGEDSEINGIGLDEDAILSTDALFQIGGTQISSAANQDYNTYSGNDWMHFVIPVGEFYTGIKQYLFFANDADAG